MRGHLIIGEIMIGRMCMLVFPRFVSCISFLRFCSRRVLRDTVRLGSISPVYEYACTKTRTRVHIYIHTHIWTVYAFECGDGVLCVGVSL